MKNKILIKILLVGISSLIVFALTVGTFGEAWQGYRISRYDVTVDISKDGSLDISERIDFSFLGNSNNAVLLIDKREDEKIEIKNVYTYVNDDLVECVRLSAGQWDANVFNGTYSEIQEKSLVRLKIYGTFKKQQAKVLVKYRVNNSIKRFKDIAVYSRDHVQKHWKGHTSNLNIKITLPNPIEITKIKPYLHGVLVGSHKATSNKNEIIYNIPNTVPGEYVEARIIFPEYLVQRASRVSEDQYLETVLQEEREYLESDKTDILKARENAAKEEGRRASNEKQKQRFKLLAVIISMFASLLGLITINKLNNIFEGKRIQESFSLEDIPNLSPPEARMLMRGNLGARGVISGLFELASKGFIGVRVKDKAIYFIIKDNCDTSLLKDSESNLLSLIKDMCNGDGHFCPMEYKILFNNSDLLLKLKKSYMVYCKSIKKEYSEKSFLKSEQVYYRSIGLIMGVFLFAAGCIISIVASIWSGYLMVLIGLLLFNYAHSAERRTGYSIRRIKALKALKELLVNDEKNVDKIPKWMSNHNLALGFAIALGAENKLSLLEGERQDKNDVLLGISKGKEGEPMKTILINTLVATDLILYEML